MIISIDTEIEVDKIQHPFIKKTLIKVSTEGSYLNTINTIYDKPTANRILKAFLINSVSRQACRFSPLLSNIVVEVLATKVRQEK